MARATGLSRTTIRKGAVELERGPVAAEDRVRRPGAGRKRATERDPGLVAALEALVDPHTRGDPESPLRWTCKSTRQLADALTAAGHPTLIATGVTSKQPLRLRGDEGQDLRLHGIRPSPYPL